MTFSTLTVIEGVLPAIVGTITLIVCAHLIVVPLLRRQLRLWVAARGWRKPRQRRKAQSARNVLARLGELPNDQARFAYLRAVDPFVFEELVLEAFERKGHKVRRNTRYTGDGGIDGRVWSKSGVLHLVQAKRYSGHINAQHVEEFARVVGKMKCRGIFVHCGRTGKLAHQRLQQHPELTLISGSKLLRLLSLSTRSAGSQHRTP